MIGILINIKGKIMDSILSKRSREDDIINEEPSDKISSTYEVPIADIPILSPSKPQQEVTP